MLYEECVLPIFRLKMTLVMGWHTSQLGTAYYETMYSTSSVVPRANLEQELRGGGGGEGAWQLTARPI